MEKQYRTQVSIVKSDDVFGQIRQAVDLIGGIKKYVKEGDRVLLKPNITGPSDPKKGVTTTAEFVEGVIRLVQEANPGSITVADGTGSATIGTLKVMDMIGYSYLKDKYDITLLDLNRVKCIDVKVPEPYHLETVRVAECIFTDFDVIINLPVLKTHRLTKTSLSLKNMKGCIPPSEKRKMHDLGVWGCVADLCSVTDNDLIIVDGTIGSEGLGPKEGTPVGMKTVLAGTDMVAVDTVCCKVMGFDPEDMKLIKMVHDRGKGIMNLDEIEILGDSIESVMHKFKPAECTIPPDGKGRIISGSPCSGCITAAVIAMSRLADSGMLDKLNERGIVPTFAIGPSFKKDQEWPDPEHVVILGNCAKHMSSRGKYYPGCSPSPIMINAWLAEQYGLDTEVLEVVTGDQTAQKSLVDG